MDNITASELAGFGVGTLLLCATIAAPKIDSFISASQRRYRFLSLPAFLGLSPFSPELLRYVSLSCARSGFICVLLGFEKASPH